MRSSLIFLFVFLLGLATSFAEAQPDSPKRQQQVRVFTGTAVVVHPGEVYQDLVIIAGSADIYGEIQGDLTVIGGRVMLSNTAVISGDVTLVGSPSEVDPGAQWGGNWVEVAGPFDDGTWAILTERVKEHFLEDFNQGTGFWLFLALLKTMFLIGFAFIALHVAPYFCDRSLAHLNDKLWFCGIWGILSTLLVLPITIFLTLTIVGLPLLPLQYSLLFLFFLTGHFLVGASIVEQLQNKLGKKCFKTRWATASIGVVLMEIILLVPVIGNYAYWLLLLAGFGATSRAFYAQILKPKRVSVP